MKKLSLKGNLTDAEIEPNRSLAGIRHVTQKGERLAEREGFEPPVPFRAHLISSQAPSTGLGHLSALLHWKYLQPGLLRPQPECFAFSPLI